MIFFFFSLPLQITDLEAKPENGLAAVRYEWLFFFSFFFLGVKGGGLRETAFV